MKDGGITGGNPSSRVYRMTVFGGYGYSCDGLTAAYLNDVWDLSLQEFHTGQYGVYSLQCTHTSGELDFSIENGRYLVQGVATSASGSDLRSAFQEAGLSISVVMPANQAQ